MELELTDEQQAFVETTRKFLAAECSIPTVRALEHEPAGFDADVWRRSAELGWTSLLVDEAHGGGSLTEHGLADLVLVAEEFGRTVAPARWRRSTWWPKPSRHGTDAQRTAVLPACSTAPRWGPGAARSPTPPPRVTASCSRATSSRWRPALRPATCWWASATPVGWDKPCSAPTTPDAGGSAGRAGPRAAVRRGPPRRRGGRARGAARVPLVPSRPSSASSRWPPCSSAPRAWAPWTSCSP
ncbi:MAG: acyl-CoA dehydrogenase family protein [Acidimicrobiales bacterium]